VSGRVPAAPKVGRSRARAERTAHTNVCAMRARCVHARGSWRDGMCPCEALRRKRVQGGRGGREAMGFEARAPDFARERRLLDVPRARLCAKPNECRHECAQQTPNERTPRSRSARTYARASVRAHGCRYGRCVREAPYDDRRKKPVTVTNGRAQRGRAQTNTHARAWSGRAAENTSHLAVARASTYAIAGARRLGLAWHAGSVNGFRTEVEGAVLCCAVLCCAVLWCG
jgi:hypothetical protein